MEGVRQLELNRRNDLKTCLFEYLSVLNETDGIENYNTQMNKKVKETKNLKYLMI